MNKQNRKEISFIISQLEAIKEKLDTLLEGENEKYNNMPEGLQSSEKGDKIQERITSLEEAGGNIESAIEVLNEAIED